MNHNLKIYQTDKIYLGYTIKLSQNPVDTKSAFERDIIPVKKVNGMDLYVPLAKTNDYYSLEKVVPISEKQKKKTKFITDSEIRRLIVSETK